MERHMRARRHIRLKTSAAAVILICSLSGGIILSQPAGSENAVAGMSPSMSMPIVTPSATPSVPKPLPSLPATAKEPEVLAPTAQAHLVPSVPTRIEIPSARINYPVVELPQENIIDMPGGVEINPPLNPDYVYWMSAGGMPGEEMATYLTSHSSSDASRWPLDEISNAALVKIDSAVLVTTAEGTFNYVVTELLSVPRADFATGKYGVPPKEDILVIASCNTLDLYGQTRVLVAKRMQ